MTPNRVDCFGVYGVAREVHAITGAPLGPEPWAEDATADGEGEAGRLRLGHGRGPRALPALHRARLHRRRDRPLAALAAGAPDRGRAAPDQQRRRHHQLRDAAHRPAAARLRPRRGPGRGADRPHRRAGREDDDPRRRSSASFDAETVLVCDRERALRDRRDHGRPGLRGLRARRRASCSRSRTGTGPTSCAPRACSGCARRPPRASRSSCTRSSACGRSGSPRG